MMTTRYPETIHITQEMADKINTPVDPALISSRPGGGNSTQSYLKGDIVSDALNKIFGPLGWGSKSSIKEIEHWTETKTVTRNNQSRDVKMNMVQVVSEVELTIKKVTPDGTDTVYVQPGIGYGEVEEGKSKKEAFGMAVKGSATDGLKRCGSMIGKAFGMMMASNGSQEDIEYAHNNKANDLKKARAIRSEQDRRDRGRDNDDRQNSSNRNNQTERSDERIRQEGRNDQNSGHNNGENRSQDQKGSGNNENPTKTENTRHQDVERTHEESHEPTKQNVRTTTSEETDAPKIAKAETAKDGRKADTNYPLDNLPITKQDMTDFGATLIQRVNEMRQHSDRVGLVKQHLNTIKNLDTPIRKRVIERLREKNVDVDEITN